MGLGNRLPDGIIPNDYQSGEKHPECISPNLKKKEFEGLLHEVENTIEAEYAGAVVRISGVPIVPYNHFLVAYEEDPEFGLQVTPQQYFDYVASAVQTPEDVYQVLDELIEWQPTDLHGSTGKVDLVLSPEITLSRGGGDCNNNAWLARELLKIASCKTGKEYSPRSIASGTHSICIYTDWNGSLCAINRNEHVQGFESIYDASTEFKEGAEISEEFQSGNIRYEVTLDSETLLDTKEKLYVDVFHKYKEELTANDIASNLPTDWELYKKTIIRFLDGGHLLYEKGKIQQRTLPNEDIVFYDEQERIVQKNFFNGLRKEYYDPETGVLQQRDNSDGSVEFFDADTGNLKEKRDKDGASDFFDLTTGKLQQKNYPQSSPIEADVYYPDGETLKQRHFKSSETSEHEAEWYTEQGKLRTIQYWDGVQKAVE